MNISSAQHQESFESSRHQSFFKLGDFSLREYVNARGLSTVFYVAAGIGLIGLGVAKGIEKLPQRQEEPVSQVEVVNNLPMAQLVIAKIDDAGMQKILTYIDRIDSSEETRQVALLTRLEQAFNHKALSKEEYEGFKAELQEKHANLSVSLQDIKIYLIQSHELFSSAPSLDFNDGKVSAAVQTLASWKTRSDANLPYIDTELRKTQIGIDIALKTRMGIEHKMQNPLDGSPAPKPKMT